MARALEVEGVADHTAAAFTRAVGGTRLVWREGSEADIACALDVAALRRWVSRSGAPGLARVALLGTALAERGIPAPTANSTATDLRVHWAQVVDRERARMQRLGLQGVAGGALFSAFFGWTVWAGGPGARWNLISVAFAGAIGLYGAVLWARNRGRG
ncbi:MAG: hypothetical protein EXR79_10160 [Myxococcales bacterium]|nr:hypothetical protein [Myxococcales bacterium]